MRSEYVVYAVVTTPGGVVYLIDDGGSAPFAYAAELFEVVDARTSRLWEPPTAGSRTSSIPAWSHDDDFYDHLVEGNDDGVARRLFDEAQNVMDVEFLVPSMAKAVGYLVGEGWVECAACEYLWNEASSLVNEMCTCPNCRLLLALRERGTSKP
jgi:hypothetical protein